MTWHERNTFRRLCGIVMGECDFELVKTALPRGCSLAGNATFPMHKIQCAVWLCLWPCIEPLEKRTSNQRAKEKTYKGMILAPLLALLCQTGDGQGGG